MRRWAVILNCVTSEFVNCLSLLNPGTSIHGYTIWQLREQAARLSTELKNFDAIFLYDDVLTSNLIDFSEIDNVVCVPLTPFGGYHPDYCYVSSGPVFPVYSEIAEAFGVQGSTHFSRGEYKMISLEQFITESFDIYRSHPPGSLSIHPFFEKRYSAIYDVI